MRVLAITVLIGCGFEHGRVATTVDAPVDDAVDAPEDTPGCTLVWGTPKPLTELNTSGIDNAPWLADDELTIYFTSDRAGNATNDWDIFIAKRASITEPFSPPVLLADVATSAMERNLSVSADGLTMFFATDRNGGLGNLDLWMITRSSTAEEWSDANAVPLAALNSTAFDYFPTISRDGLTLYFSSNRAGGAGNYDLYRSTRSSVTGEFLPPTNVGPPINTGAGESAHAFSFDELTLYLQSNRNTNNWDQWRSERPSTTSGFTAPVAIPELTTSHTEYIRWISPDGARAYYTSTPTSAVVWDLYVVERTCM